jgi:acyl-coenzyme A synthetase/AMP-(fatty) acid ligase
VTFIEYWRQPEATAAKFAGNWCLTGDIGIKDEAGYFWYKGREDDLISHDPCVVREELYAHLDQTLASTP